VFRSRDAQCVQKLPQALFDRNTASVLVEFPIYFAYIARRERKEISGRFASANNTDPDAGAHSDEIGPAG